MKRPGCVFLCAVAFAIAALCVSMASAEGGEIGTSCTAGHEDVQCELTYICLAGHCAKCMNDDQCTDMHPEFICDMGSGRCHHKPLFSGPVPFSWRDALGSVIIFVFSAVAAGAGIGGGGIYVPVFVIVFSFGTHNAVPLSKATAFGTSASTVIFNYLLKKRHPLDRHRPVTDYDSVLMFEPLVLMGASIGVILNAIFPSWLILILLVLVLSWVTKKTLAKGIETMRKETYAKKARKKIASSVVTVTSSSPSSAPSPDSADAEKDVVFAKYGTLPANASDVSPLLDPAEKAATVNDGALLEDNPKLAYYNKRCRNNFPLDKVGLVLFVWGMILLLAAIRGGHGGGSIAGITKCSTKFWLVFAMIFPLCIGVTLLGGRLIMKEHAGKKAAGFRFLPGDFDWTSRAALLYCLLSFGGGLATSLLGLGGAMFLGPVLYHMGLNPLVVSATGSFSVLLTASSTTLQFLLAGSLQLDYASWLWFLGFTSAIVGQFVISKLLKKYQRASLIIFLVVGILVMSCILMGVNGVMESVERSEAGASLWFLDYCSTGN